MLVAKIRNCGWREGPARHLETWWWNYVGTSVSEKFKPLKEWKQGNTGMKKYMGAKKKARGAVYQAKCTTKRKRSGNVMLTDEM